MPKKNYIRYEGTFPRYIRDIPGMTVEQARVLFYWAFYNTDIRMVDKMPIIDGTTLNEAFCDVINKCFRKTYVPIGPHEEFDLVRGNGMSDYAISWYAYLCNTLTADVVVFPSSMARNIQRLSPNTIYYSHPQMKRVFNTYWPLGRNVLFRAKSYCPKYILFPGQYKNDLGHSILFVLRYNGESKDGEKHYYKLQVLDAFAGAYVEYWPTKEDVRDLCDKFEYYFQDVDRYDIVVQPEFERDLITRKRRQGEYQCGMFTCMHMRYFCGTLPLFVGYKQLGCMAAVIRYELHNGLIDYFQLLRNVDDNVYKYIGYLQYCNVNWDSYVEPRWNWVDLDWYDQYAKYNREHGIPFKDRRREYEHPYERIFYQWMQRQGLRVRPPPVAQPIFVDRAELQALYRERRQASEPPPIRHSWIDIYPNAKRPPQ